MADLFDLKILTPDKLLYNGKAQSLVLPSSLGYLGILAHHAPVCACLVKGNIIVRDAQSKVSTFPSLDGGILEVSENKATIVI